MAQSDIQAWQVDRLLLQREAAFAHIYALERKIEERLGAPYPFEPPEVMPPSLEKPKPKTRSPKKKPVKRKAADTGFKLRTLRDDEVAYEVRFRQARGVQKERHTDRPTLEKLLNQTALRSRVLLVQTLTAAGESGEVLYDPATAEG